VWLAGLGGAACSFGAPIAPRLHTVAEDYHGGAAPDAEVDAEEQAAAAAAATAPGSLSATTEPSSVEGGRGCTRPTVRASLCRTALAGTNAGADLFMSWPGTELTTIQAAVFARHEVDVHDFVRQPTVLMDPDAVFMIGEAVVDAPTALWYAPSSPDTHTHTHTHTHTARR